MSDSFLARIYRAAANIWHAIVAADEQIVQITADHPEIIAAAKALESSAPPEVRAGLDTAKELAHAVNGIIVHSQDIKDHA